jgi:hypothetical protein
LRVTVAGDQPSHNHPLKVAPLSETANGEWTDLGNAFIVAVDMKNSEAVVNGGLGYQKGGYRCAVPHPVVVREGTLQLQRPIENVRWWRDHVEAVV